MGTNGLLSDGTLATDDNLKNMFRDQGIEIKKPKKTEPNGNEECTCGSGIRYDLCCSPNKQRIM